MSVQAAPGRVVLQLTGMSATKYGSMERYLLGLAQACNKRGVRTLMQYEAEPTSADYRNALRDAGVTTVIAPLGPGGLTEASRLLSLLRATRPVVAHSHFLHRRLGPVIGLARKVGIVGTAITMVHNVYRLERSLKIRAAFAGFDWVLGVSEAAAADVREGGVPPDRVRTHYMGLLDAPSASAARRNAMRERLGVPPDAVVIANIAFELPFKGVDVLLEAFALARQQLPNLVLLQLGVDPTRSQLPLRARALGLDDAVHWLGIRDRGIDYLDAADLYVQPSRGGEGLPLAIMEAMALGLPVVATRSSGNTEAVDDGVEGLLATPSDAHSLAEALVALGSDAARRTRCGANARLRFEAQFVGERSVADLVERYYRL